MWSHPRSLGRKFDDSNECSQFVAIKAIFKLGIEANHVYQNTIILSGEFSGSVKEANFTCAPRVGPSWNETAEFPTVVLGFG